MHILEFKAKVCLSCPFSLQATLIPASGNLPEGSCAPWGHTFPHPFSLSDSLFLWWGHGISWPGPARPAAGRPQTSVCLWQADFQADNFMWSVNDVVTTQMAFGRKKVPHPCFNKVSDIMEVFGLRTNSLFKHQSRG